MKVQVNVLYNDASWADKETGYQEGHPLRLVYGEQHDIVQHQARALTEVFANDLFRKLNIDHPQDWQDRSMSVGDVVTMGDIHLACQPSGWKRVQVNREQVTH